MNACSQVTVQTEDFVVDEVYQVLRRQHAGQTGAIVSFVGLVRDRAVSLTSDQKVNSLTLEHYPGMTEQSMQKIVDQAFQRWPLLDARVIHRVGTLPPDAQIVLVMVASAHRDAAFAGASFIMDYLKTDAVFWKRQSTTGTHDGQSGQHEEWVQSTKQDHQRARAWRDADE